MRLRSLQYSTLIVLVIAFAFGIATLWIHSMWPFAVFSGLILLTASIWFTAGTFQSIEFSWWLLLPFAVSAVAATQFASRVTSEPWLTRQAGLEWITHGCAAFLAYQVFRSERLRIAALRFFAI